MSQIKKGAIISYIAIFLNIAAGLIYTPWMVNKIGISDYGLYALIGSFLSYFIMDFGLGQAIARFIAKARAKNDHNEINKLISTTSRIYLMIDAIIAVTLIVVFLLISNIFTEFSANEIEKFKVIYCIAGFISLLSFPFMPQNGILIAYERFVVLKMCDMSQRLGIVVLMVIALLLGYGLYALVLINGLVSLSLSIYKYFYIKNKTEIKINFKIFDSGIAISLFKFSMWIFVIGIAQRLLLNVAPTILGIFTNTVQIAIFSIGMTLEAFAWTFANALNGLFLPRVAKLSLENQSRTQIDKLMIKVGRIQLLIIGFVIVGLIVLGKSFIILWMGEKFINAYWVAICLIVPGVISLTQEIATSLLYIENEVKFRAMIFIAASIVSVVTGCILAPLFGAIGSAIGVLIALLTCHVIGMNIVYAKVLKLNIVNFFRECHLKMGFPIILSGAVSLFSQYLLPADTWVLFMCQGAILGVLYYGLMWFISMNGYEKELVKELVITTKKRFFR